jgi:hypothetical protein
VARIDFEVSGGGTVYLFKPPLTAAARDWVDEHLPEDAMDWCGSSRRREPVHQRISSEARSATDSWSDEPPRQAPAARACERGVPGADLNPQSVRVHPTLDLASAGELA